MEEQKVIKYLLHPIIVATTAPWRSHAHSSPITPGLNKRYDMTYNTEQYFGGTDGRTGGGWECVGDAVTVWTPTPTMVVLVATCLSRLGLSCLGRRLQLLQHRRAGVELADRRRPRQVLDHFNLYCICFPPKVTSRRRDGRGRWKEKSRWTGLQWQGGDERKQRARKRKQKRKSEWDTATMDARILSRFTTWSQNQQKLWARKGEECSRTGKKRRD